MNNLKIFQGATIGSLIAFSICNGASGIVVRHDKPAENYLADLNDFPPLATFYNIGVHGTLIEPEWLLTATHTVFCLNTGQPIKVGNELVEVESTYSYPSYELGGENDLSLVKLSKPIISVQPAQLYRSKDEVNKSVWFIGSGGTGTGSTGQTISNVENNGVLRKAQNQVVSVTESDLRFVFESGINGLELEGVSGNGDSGGPAFIKDGDDYFLMGISSRADSEGKDVGEYGVEELYTRVSTHIEWIEQVISSNESERTKISSLDSFLHPGMTDENIAEICQSISIKSED
ncbi:S1 family peptidase [Aliiglaciecola lipolytica]|uniref:Peptidase S1/S6, chymotrypsin/Hap n=1 Tax=Aliiglaciecola lipolytica E3 TaxID=1127673 RepID=K6Y970_9ALTE|nr:trypsin-like serine protease [Aliiglaciecola lipolytica]GAC14747.1 peptidase S1/S6, chymotrypsin/Hap [Aliiglaciecola lipolytica E3]